MRVAPVLQDNKCEAQGGEKKKKGQTEKGWRGERGRCGEKIRGFFFVIKRIKGSFKVTVDSHLKEFTQS